MTTKVTGSVLANTSVTAGTYGGAGSTPTVNHLIPVITVDAQGRLTSAANVTITNTAVYANSGQLTANTNTGVVAVGLATSGAVAGSYGSGTTTPVISVDAYGRITSVSATTITGGSAGIGATTYSRQSYTATSGQTNFTITGGYTTGFLQVYLNGVLLNASDYAQANASNGLFVLSTGASTGDIVEGVAYTVTNVLNVSPSPSGGQAGQVLYQSAANTTANTDVGTAGYLLTSQGTGKPTWSAQTSLVIANTQVGLGSTSTPQFGSLGVGTAASGVVGEIRAANNITAYYSSDIRFKENIQDIPNALEKVNAIGGKLFDWTDDYIQNHGGEDGYFVIKSDFGVIAQDVQSVFPIATRTRPDGFLAVDYEKLCALAFAAIKELKSEIEELKKK